MSAQNMDSSAQQGFPSLCSNGCGFFSSVDSKGLCSVCYKETQKKESSSSTSPQTSEASTSTSSTSQSDLQEKPTLSDNNVDVVKVEAESKQEKPSASSEDIIPPVPTSITVKTEEDKDEPIPAKKPKKSRCLTCKKKLGLTGFTCRCGDLFCSLHRYSDMHDCSFDYNAMGKKEIRENNPQIVAEKVAKI